MTGIDITERRPAAAIPPPDGRSAPAAARGPDPRLRTALLAGPLAGLLVASLQALLLHQGWLSGGSAALDAALLALALVLAGGCVVAAIWQQRALAGLPRMAASRPGREDEDPRGAPVPVLDRDALTGLLSAAGLRATVRDLIERTAGTGDRQLLLIVDIARLRDVNGTYGFEFGDQLLRLFARRLTSLSERAAAAARIGGDRFALLVAGDADPAPIANQVCDALARPFRVLGCEVSLRCHVGIAQFPDHATAFDGLMRAAELALQGARRSDGRWRLFDPQLNRAAIARKTMEKELRHALEQEQFRLYYQPQIDLVQGKVLAVEALLRWQHPERGLVAPQAFIPVAEASGLIRPIGGWVLAEACRAAKRWHDRAIPVGVAVNVSTAQLKHQDLAATVRTALAGSGLPPDVLELELTESMFVDPAEFVVHRAVQAIAAMGVRLAIDDFGTGYSALGYLKRLPVHKIKIDKSFVRDLGRAEDEPDAAIVRSIIGLAQTFGKRVLAEGIETAAQYRFLAGEGCHEGQGYHFARPMPEQACTEFLAQHVLHPATIPAAHLLAG